jgi:hypothetical protein
MDAAEVLVPLKWMLLFLPFSEPPGQVCVRVEKWQILYSRVSQWHKTHKNDLNRAWKSNLLCGLTLEETKGDEKKNAPIQNQVILCVGCSMLLVPGPTRPCRGYVKQDSIGLCIILEL